MQFVRVELSHVRTNCVYTPSLRLATFHSVTGMLYKRLKEIDMMQLEQGFISIRQTGISIELKIELLD